MPNKINDPYTHFSQQPHNKLTWLIILQKENKKIRDLIFVQHQYNNCTTTPHMRVSPNM
jgi:hypothetical protein